MKALRLHERSLVLVPLNDNPFADHAAGGTHWSLLAFRRPPAAAAAEVAAGTAASGPAAPIPVGFSHWDSSNGANARVARKMAAALAPLLTPASAGAAAPVVTVQSPQCLQQSNGYDCGVYCAWFQHALVHQFVAEEPAPLVDTAAAAGTAATATSDTGAASPSLPAGHDAIVAVVFSGIAACGPLPPSKAAVADVGAAYRAFMAAVLDAHRMSAAASDA